MHRPFAVIRLRSAIRDLQLAGDYLHEEGGLKLAKRFLKQVERTFRDLARMPHLGPKYETDNPRLAGARYWQVKGFANYLVFYQVIDPAKTLRIIRVLHGARDVGAILESI